jgi:hypothetical protein
VSAVSRLVLNPLLKPLLMNLASVGELFISHDGELNRLPFADLPVGTAPGPTLVESVRLRLPHHRPRAGVAPTDNQRRERNNVDHRPGVQRWKHNLIRAPQAAKWSQPRRNHA